MIRIRLLWGRNNEDYHMLGLSSKGYTLLESPCQQWPHVFGVSIVRTISFGGSILGSQGKALKESAHTQLLDWPFADTSRAETTCQFENPELQSQKETSSHPYQKGRRTAKRSNVLMYSVLLYLHGGSCTQQHRQAAIWWASSLGKSWQLAGIISGCSLPPILMSAVKGYGSDW